MAKKPSKRPKPDSNKDRHVKPLLALRLPAELIEALRAMSLASRRTMTTEATIALEEYLAKHERWPPPAAE